MNEQLPDEWFYLLFCIGFILLLILLSWWSAANEFHYLLAFTR